MLPDIWRRPWLGSSSLFEEMNREFAEAEDMLSRMFRTVSDIAPSTGTLTEFPYYYGYQIELKAITSITPDLRYLVGSDANSLYEKRKNVPERKFLEFMSENILGSGNRLH